MVLLESITLSEFVPICCTSYVLACVGAVMVPDGSWQHRWARRLAGAAFIGYALIGFMAWSHSSAWDVLGTIIRALLACGLVCTSSRILIAAGSFAYEHTLGEMLKKARKAAEERQREKDRIAYEQQAAEQRRLLREKQERIRAIQNPPKPPPPTREELLDRIEKQYQTDLQVAQAHTDEDTRDIALAEAERKHRERLAKLMNGGGA